MARRVNFADPEYEPTDEELAELMSEAFAAVRAKGERTGAGAPGASALSRDEVQPRLVALRQEIRQRHEARRAAPAPVASTRKS